MMDLVIRQAVQESKATGQHPEIPLNLLPRSQRAFNAWNSSVLPRGLPSDYRSFRENGNATLLRNADLLKALQDRIAVLTRLEDDKPAQRRQESVSRLQRKLEIEKALRSIAEAELVRSRAQLWRMTKALEAANASIQSAEGKAKEMIEDLEGQLSQALDERAELARTLKSVTGLRRTSR